MAAAGGANGASGGYPAADGGAPASAGAVVAFSPLLPAPDVAFWQRLTAKKLDELRLDSRELVTTGYYEAPSSAASQPKCFLLGESFSEEPGFPAGSVSVRGHLKNFNTKEEFRDFLSSGARAARVTEAAVALREAILSGDALKDPVKLRPMIIVAFADLKKYHFAYTVGFPVLGPPGADAWSSFRAPCPAVDAGFPRSVLSKLSQQLQEDAALCNAGAFLLVRSGESWDVRSLASLLDITEAPSDEVAIGFMDSSADVAPGWPLRNLILALAHHRPGQWRILAFRDPHLCSRGPDVPPRSRVFHVDARAAGASLAMAAPPPPEAQFAGWAKIQNFDLTAFLDKKRIAADAVDLNLKLMKWRLLPELEPERMKERSFLLLGSGTLGCSVARTLMGWGVRRMTFVDSGKVSLSNPVRQSLFTHQDAADGRSKALAASEAVKAVMPDAEVEHLELEIPMPGHSHQSADGLKTAFTRLRDLIARHDVVCMLTDSRESRWLPSLLICSAQRQKDSGRPPPLGITVALGFDSFLVSRQTYQKSPSACYFCNDMSAPADSIAFRTLDQQCTVTRPGLSGLSSSIAVELIAALVQHKDGFGAGFAEGDQESPLGKVPHQIRGYLADYRLAPAETEPFPKCICCSQAVIDRYDAEGLAFIERVTANSSELESISGLKDMKEAVREDEVIGFDDFDDM